MLRLVQKSGSINAAAKAMGSLIARHGPDMGCLFADEKTDLLPWLRPPEVMDIVTIIVKQEIGRRHNLLNNV